MTAPVARSSGARALNVTGDEHCRYCCNDALITTGGRTEKITALRPVDIGDGVVVKRRVHEGRMTARFNEYGPCPMCEKGKAVEFPDDGFGPWGKDGFWQGVNPLTMVGEPVCSCSSKPSHPREAMDMLRSIRAQLIRMMNEKSEKVLPSRPVIDVSPERPRAQPVAAASAERPRVPDNGTLL